MAATFVLGQGRTREIGLITENDLYTSSKNDKYYTNRWKFFIGFSEEWHRESKKIVEFRIGQLIYNPQFINKGAIAVIDRPLQAIFWGGRESFFSK
jgi:hypothetical protein